MTRFKNRQPSNNAGGACRSVTSCETSTRAAPTCSCLNTPSGHLLVDSLTSRQVLGLGGIDGITAAGSVASSQPSYCRSSRGGLGAEQLPRQPGSLLTKSTDNKAPRSTRGPASPWRPVRHISWLPCSCCCCPTPRWTGRRLYPLRRLCRSTEVADCACCTMISDAVYELCSRPESVSSELAKNPTEAPYKIAKQLYGSVAQDTPAKAAENPGEYTQLDLDRAYDCGQWGPSRPSNLFLKACSVKTIWEAGHVLTEQDLSRRAQHL